MMDPLLTSPGLTVAPSSKGVLLWAGLCLREPRLRALISK
jgi:hypothetical protein